MPRKIRIAGSGPAGLTAAINLAKAGYEVHVYERNADAGQRFHGDLQGLENWSRKRNVLEDFERMNISFNFDHDPFSVLTLTNGSASHEYRLKTPLYYLVKRGSVAGSIDQGLKHQAVQAGVALHYNQSFPVGQADVCATGPRLGEVFAVDTGIIFKTSLPDMAVGVLHDPLAWKGYGYLLVTNGYGCLCVMLFEKFPQANRCFRDTKELLAKQYDLDIQNPKNVGGLGSFTSHPEWQRGQQLFVGEAAGLQDFLWGFGIRNAITSGWLAAQSIISGFPYQKLARAKFGNRARASLVNRWLWHKASRRNYTPIINTLRATPDPLGLLRSFYNYNPLQRLLFPIANRRMKRDYAKLTL